MVAVWIVNVERRPALSVPAARTLLLFAGEVIGQSASMTTAMLCRLSLTIRRTALEAVLASLTIRPTALKAVLSNSDWSSEPPPS
jgi:hypothetical protein